MARINTNVAALTAQRGLGKSQKNLNDTLQRLSTGLRINRGADDPAGLIASERLRSEIEGISQGIDNSQRASNVVSTTEGALSEVNSLLLNIKSLVVEAANSGALSPDEIQANQLQIDSAVSSISRISNTTTFAGLHLLNGSLDYVTSGLNTAVLRETEINQANFGQNTSIPVQVDVLTSARPAELQLATSAAGASVTLELAGNEGVETLTFASGTAASAIAFAVNRVSDNTGVSAVYINSATPTAGIKFISNDFGSKQFVSVRALSGTLGVTDSSGNSVARSTGQDIVANVNGSLTYGEGRTIKYNSSSLDATLKIDKNFGIGSTSFAITGGGAKFQLGPEVTSNQQVNIGIHSIAASKLGNLDIGFLTDIATGGTKSLVKDKAAEASKIIEKSINQVAVIRGRLGAFEKNVLDTNQASLGVTLENVTASESSIRDADFAKETSELTRNQILTQAGTSVLSTANSTPQSVLSLLQR